MALNAFISYSHKDSDVLESLHDHLAPLKREGLLTTWTDRDIHPGGIIDNEVATQLGSCEVYLLLISSAFLASNYCFETEFKNACKRQESGDAIIVPIIIKECAWQIPQLSQFKALPRDGKPVFSQHWHTPDAAFTDVVVGLRELIKTLQSKGVVSRKREHVADDKDRKRMLGVRVSALQKAQERLAKLSAPNASSVMSRVGDPEFSSLAVSFMNDTREMFKKVSSVYLQNRSFLDADLSKRVMVEIEKHVEIENERVSLSSKLKRGEEVDGEIIAETLKKEVLVMYRTVGLVVEAVDVQIRRLVGSA